MPRFRRDFRAARSPARQTDLHVINGRDKQPIRDPRVSSPFIRTPWRFDNERRKALPPFHGRSEGPDFRPELSTTISRRGAPRRTGTPFLARSAL